MNLNEEYISSVSSFYVLLRFSCRLIVYFVFCFVSLSFCLCVCLFVILLKKRENGRAMASRRHSENRGLAAKLNVSISKVVYCE